ncbi:MAG: carboxypeptidase-like regulatory domain-containing protein, partial [candidate division KSB1 bacterium]
MKWSFQKLCCLAIMSVMLLVSVTPSFGGTTGKISGQVVDKKTGTALPGATVLLVGTSLGAAADVNGNYFILNVPPGVYSVRASVVGYSAVVQSGVRVNIDLTATVDFKGNYALQEEAIQA